MLVRQREEVNVVEISSHLETNILRNGDKGVANYIMGSNAFIVMSKCKRWDTHRVDGMCAHTSKDAYNWRMG